jgi:hypothetical protein
MRFKALVTLCISLVASGAGATQAANSVTPLDGNGWRLAPDPKKVGVAEKWWESPRPEAKTVKVPRSIQGILPGYAGVPWFDRRQPGRSPR